AIGDPGVARNQHRGVNNRNDHHTQRHVGIPVKGGGLTGLSEVVNRNQDRKDPQKRQDTMAKRVEEFGVMLLVIERQRQIAQPVDQQEQDGTEGGGLHEHGEGAHGARGGVAADDMAESPDADDQESTAQKD